MHLSRLRTDTQAPKLGSYHSRGGVRPQCTCRVYGQMHQWPHKQKNPSEQQNNQIWTDRKRGASKRSKTGAKRAQPSGHGGQTQNKQARRQRGESKSATQGVGGKKKWVISDSVECIQDSGVCPLGECHSSYSRWQRRPVSLLHLLLPSDVRRCMQPRTQRMSRSGALLRNFPIWEDSLSHMLLQSLFRHIVSWSLEQYSAGKLSAIDFPLSEHMLMLNLLLELRSILVETFGRVPQSQEAVIGWPVKRAQSGCLLPPFRRQSCSRWYNYFQVDSDGSSWLQAHHRIGVNYSLCVSSSEF